MLSESPTREVVSREEAPAGSPASGAVPARGRRRLLYRDVSRRLYWGVAIGSFVLLIAGWWLYAEFGGQSDLFLPSPVQVANRLIDLAQDGSLWDDVKISFARVSIGFLLSSAMALPIGILIGSYRLAEAAIEPTMGFIRYMPAVAFVPLTIIWVGVGEEQKWLVIWIGTFFSQVLLVMDNVKRVRQELVGIGYTLGMNEASILGRIVIPASAPAIWDTLRVTLGWAWTWLVLAELVAAESGLGHRVVLAQRFFQTDTIFVALIVIGAIGLAMDQLMKFAGRRLFHWAERG